MRFRVEFSNILSLDFWLFLVHLGPSTELICCVCTAGAGPSTFPRPHNIMAIAVPPLAIASGVVVAVEVHIACSMNDVAGGVM